MELDDLKQAWQEPGSFQKPLNSNIMQLIQNDSYGPLATLTGKFKKQLIGVPVLIGLFIYQFITRHELFESPGTWILYSAAALISVYFAYNYYLASKLQSPAEAVKQNMELQVSKLERSFKWYQAIATIYLILLPIGIELSLQFHIEKDFEGWGEVSIYLRVLGYIAGFIFVTLLNRRVFRKQYGDHLKNLRELIGKME